jgi:hypothetical protein
MTTKKYKKRIKLEAVNSCNEIFQNLTIVRDSVKNPCKNYNEFHKVKHYQITIREFL